MCYNSMCCALMFYYRSASENIITERKKKSQPYGSCVSAMPSYM